MHPIALIAAAAVALLIYSNFVFYFRPPIPKGDHLETHPASEFERRRNENYPFFCPGLPPMPAHALAIRDDDLSAGSRHVILPEPRCRRVLHAVELGDARGGVVPVVLALDRQAKIKVGLPSGYSLFLPPSWRAQMVVPERMACRLYSSDSVGSLCLRLPKLMGPFAEKAEAVARSCLEDVLAILGTPPERRRSRRPRVEGPSQTPCKSASCTPSAPAVPIAHPGETDRPSARPGVGLPPASAANCPSSQPSLIVSDITMEEDETIPSVA